MNSLSWHFQFIELCEHVVNTQIRCRVPKCYIHQVSPQCLKDFELPNLQWCRVASGSRGSLWNDLEEEPLSSKSFNPVSKPILDSANGRLEICTQSILPSHITGATRHVQMTSSSLLIVLNPTYLVYKRVLNNIILLNLL